MGKYEHQRSNQIVIQTTNDITCNYNYLYPLANSMAVIEMMH